MPVDFIEVKSPFVDMPLRYFTVLGNGGMTFGIDFYESPYQLKNMLEHQEPIIELHGKHWSVLFGPIVEIPFADADLWQDHNLPVADQQAYPLAMCTEAGHKVLRPGPDILAFLEGLLRLLAKTRESDLDNETWGKNVSTFKGNKKYSLALVPWDQDSSQTGHTDKHIPDLRSLESQTATLHRAIEEQEFDNIDEINEFIKTKLQDGRFQSAKPKTDLEKAQDLAYQAFDAFGRKQLQLARKALEICPDCADAYVVLAEREVDLDKTYELYKNGLDAGRRALGDRYFKENAGSFWGLIKTRPFMRALLGLAQCCECMDLEQEALDYYNELLRLNPNDNQGVRDSLLCFLLDLGKDKDAEKLLKRYKKDNIFALWCYSRALITFRQKGDTASARKHLQKALQVNPMVSDYLLEPELLPGFGSESFSLGSQEEAILCVEKLEGPWHDTPGAIEWLESHANVGPF
jgi:tetratricopeptide (TPR) repeat protein